MTTTTVTLSHYTLPDGARVHQVMVNGMPIMRETEEVGKAAIRAIEILHEIRTGSVPGTSPHQVLTAEWDGDLGYYLHEPALWNTH